MSTPAATPIRWKDIESNCIKRVGWDDSGAYIEFRGRGALLYRYAGCSRQRIIALARSSSPGQYFNAKVAPRFSAWVIAHREEE